METNLEHKILAYIEGHKGVSSKEVHEFVHDDSSYATVKRILNRLQGQNLVSTKGKGKATKYLLSPLYEVIKPIDLEKYFENEIDQRVIKEHFNLELLRDTLRHNSVFSEEELLLLQNTQNQYLQNIAQLSDAEFKNELERLAIDLSWKSSQIEGNTYSLLETERLLKEKETAAGKTKEEAVMLLNHKEAIDFIVQNPDYLTPITVSKIEDIQSILIKELGVERNVRKRRVGISGTNYKPLDNEFQIREALTVMCDVINEKEPVFEKSLLALLLLSYIQPFSDGNKRTARIVSNAILIHYGYCPLSFRTVDSIDYKKAMLLFYEQNNLSAFKNIFIDQFEFAVRTYF